MRLLLLSVFTVSCFSNLLAEDWSRFRGPNGQGISSDGAVPTEWGDDSKNLKWKLALPGPGQSSPIVVGDKVFVTCWSGYGMTRDNLGDQKELLRHLVCINRNTGEIIWDKTVEPYLPEETYQGMFAENGYASHTPVSDGTFIYVFFGKSGVFAFDMNGEQIWQRSVGTENDRRGWGTASSPILVDNLLIVPATIESKSMLALNKQTGEIVWQKEAQGFDSTWGTPVVVELENGQKEIVFSVPYEIWAFNPETGKLNWYCESVDSDSICSSIAEHDGIVYVIEGRSGGAVAVKTGGKGDVTKTNVLWSGRNRGRISTPIYYEGRLHWVTGGIASCIDAKTGEEVYQSRLQASSTSSESTQNTPLDREESGDRDRSGGRAGRGGPGGQSYSSPVVADGKLYYFDRSGNGYVIKLGQEFEQIAVNKFTSDSSDFNGTPAVSNGQLFVRSNTHLYCIASPE